MLDFGCFEQFSDKVIKSKNPEAELHGFVYFDRTTKLYDQLSDLMIHCT